MTSIKMTTYSDLPKLVSDYLTKQDDVAELYSYTLSKESILKLSRVKTEKYNLREELIKELKNQYTSIELTKKQKEHIDKLESRKTLTITTGHQLNLLTGSVFYHYKIIQTIKLCNELNEEQDEFYYVPIFWMATEDHDFKEINHFYFEGSKYESKGENTIPVGRRKSAEFESILNQYLEKIKYYSNYKELKEIIEKSYFESDSLTEATRKLVQYLYGELGLLCIDGDSKNLKRCMVPYFKKELISQLSYQYISETTQKLKFNNYKVQVNPREINLFYIANEGRFRIVYDNKKELYRIKETILSFSLKEMLSELENNPERFSPNALLRPFYQEIILPNVAYIGGNAEIAYWLELKGFFDSQQVEFPILIPRNSITFINEKQKEKLEKLNIDYFDLLNDKESAIKDYIKKNKTIHIDFDTYEKQIEKMYSEMILESKKTDITLENLLQAQQKKQFNAFDKLRKRILKAEKRKQVEKINQIEKLYDELFPFGKPQERILNFSEFFGKDFDFIDVIYENINSIEPEYKVIYY
ncbi:MAG: bacillithiol biosynthesis cysteine-adding enzyme BshC [Flavobacteriales bacterium]|nr:bacillithiol biosynthesis cysteine-adding enzyme BshC [Flavobacteriales bacterium]